MHGLATHNLLKTFNDKHRDPWLDADNELLDVANPAPKPRNPEGRLLFQGLLILVFFIGLFALVIRDLEIRDRRDRALIEAANRPVAEVCEYLELTYTPYTYAICTQKNASGKVVYRREGM